MPQTPRPEGRRNLLFIFVGLFSTVVGRALLFVPNVVDGWVLARKVPTALRHAVVKSTATENTGPEEGEEGRKLRTLECRLLKPVGLMLEEVEPGKPGLVVGDLVDGGSAKDSGVIKPGMLLLSTCGEDCSGLDFDTVVEVLNEAPEGKPIEFVFGVKD
ncbi:unnamed protein product [Discosporangium mesarthrocarpum]